MSYDEPRFSSTVEVKRAADGRRVGQYDIDVTFATVETDKRQKFSYSITRDEVFTEAQLSELLTEVGAEFVELVDLGDLQGNLITYTYLSDAQIEEIKSDPGIKSLGVGGEFMSSCYL